MANNYEAVIRHADEAGIYNCPGLRLALANASSPGMIMHFLAMVQDNRAGVGQEDTFGCIGGERCSRHMGRLLVEMSTSCAGLNEFYSNRTSGKVSTKAHRTSGDRNVPSSYFASWKMIPNV